MIENQLKQSLLIEQIMVVGRKNMASALIQPSFEQAKIWLEEQGVGCEDDLESLCKNQVLFEKINDEIRLHDHKLENGNK